MKILLYVFLFIFLTGNPINKISRINEIKKAAEKNYQSQNYKEAIRQYRILIDSMNVVDQGIYLNMGHCYFFEKQKDSALIAYKNASRGQEKTVKSFAYQQIGTLMVESEKYEEALTVFKESLINNPSNQDAKYNYELIKKLLKEQEQKQDHKNQEQEEKENQDQKEQQQKENQDQEEKQKENQDQKEQQQRKKNQDQGQKEEKKENEAEKEKQEDQKEKDSRKIIQRQQRLQEINMTEEKAKMILEAMKNNEVKYYQQLKKKLRKPKDSSKPDW